MVQLPTLIGCTCSFLVAVMVARGRGDDVTSSRHQLASSRPAERWEEAMLTGNGNMGAMVFGRPCEETLVVNHCELYLPLGNREIVQDFADSMPEFKAAGLEAGMNGPAVVHQMMQQRTTQKIVPTDPFHPAYLMSLKMGGGSAKLRAYQRTQNLANGEVIVRWSDDSGDWQRKLFVSRPANLVVLQIGGPSGKVECELSLDISHELVESEIEAADGWISTHAEYTKGKGGYDSLLRATSVGGQILSRDGKLRVSGADQVLVLMQVRTWRTPLPPEQSEAWAYSPEHPDFAAGRETNLLPDMKRDLQRASASYEELLDSHASVHGEFYQRTSLDLQADTEQRAMTSEALLEQAIREGQMSPALMERER